MAKKAANAPVVKRLTIKRISPESMGIVLSGTGRFSRGVGKREEKINH
jgi:hypothetical protein